MVRKLSQDGGAINKKPDKRPPEQRQWIDKAVRLYILRHDIEHHPQFSFAKACRNYWKGAEAVYKGNKRQYENNVYHDYKRFYDIEAEKSKINSGTVTVP